MSITALPTPPSRQDPTNFPARADAFLGALPTFATEANALQADVNSKQITASDAATTATTKAAEAISSANNAADSELAAANSAAEAALLTEKYQGALTSDPTVDKGGNPITAGDWYVNSSTGYIRIYNGSAWVQGISSIAGVTSVNGMTGVVTGIATTTDLGTKQDTLVAGTNIKTINGSSLLGSGDIAGIATTTQVAAKQDTLVSGTNIKTINGSSLLGSGNISTAGLKYLNGGTIVSGANSLSITGLNNLKIAKVVLFISSSGLAVPSATVNEVTSNSYNTVRTSYGATPTVSISDTILSSLSIATGSALVLDLYATGNALSFRMEHNYSNIATTFGTNTFITSLITSIALQFPPSNGATTWAIFGE